MTDDQKYSHALHCIAAVLSLVTSETGPVLRPPCSSSSSLSWRLSLPGEGRAGTRIARGMGKCRRI